MCSLAVKLNADDDLVDEVKDFIAKSGDGN